MIRRFIFLGAPGVGKGTFASLLAPRLNLKVITAGDLLRDAIRKAEGVEDDSPAAIKARELKAIVKGGNLVPDQVIVPLVADSIPKDSTQGYILDGFPRTVPQADALTQRLSLRGLPPIQRVINIELEEWVAVAKLLGRVVCSACGKGFNTAHIVDGKAGYDMPAIPPPSSLEECPSLSLSSSSFTTSSFSLSQPSSSVTTTATKRTYCPAAEGKLIRRSDDTEETIKRRLEVHRQATELLLHYYQDKAILRYFRVLKGVKDVDALEQVMTIP